MQSTAQSSRRPSRLRLGLIAAAAVTALTVTIVTPGAPAQAEDAWGFPTWSEVEAARGDVAAQQSQIAEIRDLISRLESEQAAAEQVANQRAGEAAEAQDRFDEAAFTASQLEEQAAAAQRVAEDSQRAASQLAAQLARTGGAGDLSVELFANPGSADEWLYRLSLLDSAASTADTLYTQAQQDANTAQSLQDQAGVARDERQRLSDEANAALEAATTAAAEAAAAVDRTNAHKAELEAQLSVLEENRAATEADYNAGQAWYAYLAEQERIRQEQERIAREAAAAELLRQQQAAAAAAAAAGGGGSSSGGGGGGGGGYAGPGVSNGGWTSPHYGRISSTFGWRTDPVTGSFSKLHAGLDIVAGCGTPIYAAAAGTVAVRGQDSYGANMIWIDHGGGVQTRYYHMAAPSPLGYGQSVAAGQVVGYEGSTGWSTGCHLHFEVRVGGVAQDPLGFLRARGANI